MNKEKIKLLQKKYEMGQIKEEEMLEIEIRHWTKADMLLEIEKESLLLLYEKQIEFLEDSVSKYEEKLKNCKERIINIKKNARNV